MPFTKQDLVNNWEKALYQILSEDGYIVSAFGKPKEIGQKDEFLDLDLVIAGTATREEGIAQMQRAAKILNLPEDEFEPPPINGYWYRSVLKGRGDA